MHAGISEFLEEQTKGLAELVENFRKSRVAAARKAAIESAARIKALNGRVRNLARSGVKLTGISHDAAQSLIELQSDIVTAALNDAAAQLQRIADTASVRDLARDQAEVLKATRKRIVDDLARAMTILKEAARDARAVTERRTARPAAPKKAVRGKARSKARGKVGKTARNVRRART
jgi:phasin family protein